MTDPTVRTKNRAKTPILCADRGGPPVSLDVAYSFIMQQQSAALLSKSPKCAGNHPYGDLPLRCPSNLSSL